MAWVSYRNLGEVPRTWPGAGLGPSKDGRAPAPPVTIAKWRAPLAVWPIAAWPEHSELGNQRWLFAQSTSALYFGALSTDVVTDDLAPHATPEV